MRILDEIMMKEKFPKNFSDWENRSIRSFDLKEFTTHLCGFGKDHWLEWEIHRAKMHAEFEENHG